MKINNYKTCSQELWAILVDRRLVSLDEVMERLTLQNKELNNLLAISQGENKYMNYTIIEITGVTEAKFGQKFMLKLKEHGGEVAYFSKYAPKVGQVITNHTIESNKYGDTLKKIKSEDGVPVVSYGSSYKKESTSTPTNNSYVDTQVSKNEAIKRAGSISNATNLTICLMEQKVYENSGIMAMNIDDVKKLLEANVKWFESLYDL